MATVDFASRAVYACYKNGTALASSSSEYRRVGYNSSDKYVTVYKFVLPTIDGTITSFTLTPYLQNHHTGYLGAGHTWKIAWEPWTNSTFNNGVYSNNLSGRTKTFSNPSQINAGAEVTLPSLTFTASEAGTSAQYLVSGATLYLYVYSGENATNSCVITSLQGTVTYTPTTYYTVSTSQDSYSYARVNNATSAKVTAGTSVSLHAYTPAHTATYLYFLKQVSLPNGIVAFNEPSGTRTDYTMSFKPAVNGTFAATGRRVDADPGDVTCSASNVTSNSARVTVPSGITTTYLDGNYYISTTNASSTKSLSYTTAFARSTGYKDLTGLLTGTAYTYYIYAYNSYNGYYYKIGSVSFTTDAASYSATIMAAPATESAVISLSGLSSEVNLDGNWYVSTTNSATAASLANVVSGSRSGSITLTGLSPGASYTRYVYVYSTVSKTYYRVGSVTFQTEGVIYYGHNGAFIPCHVYMYDPVKMTFIRMKVKGVVKP